MSSSGANCEDITCPCLDGVYLRHAKEALRFLLRTILFSRSLGPEPVAPSASVSELFEGHMASVTHSAPSEEAEMEKHIKRFVDMLERNQNMAAQHPGQLVVSFYTVRQPPPNRPNQESPRTSLWSAFNTISQLTQAAVGGGAEGEKVVFERWRIPVRLAGASAGRGIVMGSLGGGRQEASSPCTLAEPADAAAISQISDQVRKIVLFISLKANERVEHLPPSGAPRVQFSVELPKDRAADATSWSPRGLANSLSSLRNLPYIT